MADFGNTLLYMVDISSVQCTCVGGLTKGTPYPAISTYSLIKSVMSRPHEYCHLLQIQHGRIEKKISCLSPTTGIVPEESCSNLFTTV